MKVNLKINIKSKLFAIVLWALCLTFIVTGIVLIANSKTVVNRYQLGIYELRGDGNNNMIYRKGGKILEKYIGDDQVVTFDANYIIVTTVDKAKMGWGIGLTIFFGLLSIILIWEQIRAKRDLFLFTSKKSE